MPVIYRSSFTATFLCLMMTVVTLGCAVSEDEAQQAELDIAGAQIEVEVTATRLAEAYETNEVAANRKYDGKVLAVTGTISSVSGGSEGAALYVDLSAGGLTNVRCYFTQSHLDEIVTLSKGQRVTLKG